MTYVEGEINSQPASWDAARRLAASSDGLLPRPGERVAVVGCGTSLYMSRAYAALREGAGIGITDAWAASELPTLSRDGAGALTPAGRRYDRLIALSRSGTTTEVLDVLRRVSGTLPTTVLTADPTRPVVEAADEAIILDFAEEESVVQTRFATGALVLLRAHLGENVSRAIADAERVVAAGLGEIEELVDRRQFSFLGRGWTVALAEEAGLKMREAAQMWTEAYPAMEYRHGPISISDDRGAVWMFGEPPTGLADDVKRTGARWVSDSGDGGLDPLADLIRAQRLAVAIAQRAGIDPDHPRNLTRSIILAND